MLMFSGLASAGPVAAAEHTVLTQHAPAAPPTAQMVRTSAAVDATAAAAPSSGVSDTARYAARERQSAHARQFRGGNVVLIMSGTGVVLALVLLLLLL